jgi:hypothetical protein
MGRRTFLVSPIVPFLLFAWTGPSLARASDAPPPGAGGIRHNAPPETRKKRPNTKADDEGEGPTFKKGGRELEFRKKLGADFAIKRTHHFFVLYNGDLEVVKDFIHRLEITYTAVHRFVAQMGIDITYPKQKLPVLFCSDFDEYNARCQQLAGVGAPSDAAGLYWRFPLDFSIFYDMSQVRFIKETEEKARKLQEEARAATDPGVRRDKSREARWYLNRIDIYQQESNRSVVQHELAHQLLFNLGFHKFDADNPQWFVEGMATLFEPPPGKRGAGFNVINQHRLGEIREKVAGMSAEQFKSFIGSPSPGGGMMSSEGYAQSWAICYYLVKRQRKVLPQYVKLIRSRRRGETILPKQDVEDFEKCFGRIDEMFVKRWSNYIRKLPYRPPQ